MQDKPARKKCVFQERPCADCGEPFLPRSGRAVRCDDCRNGPAPEVCGASDCGKPLRRDNKIGYCEEHKYATARAPVRDCAADDCGNHLRADNQSGYCNEHAYLSAGTLASRERYYARLREETAQRPDMRAFCSLEGCENRLRSDNTTGRCREHHYAPIDMPECSVEGCGNRLTASNVTGRCYPHRAKYWAARTCAAEDCGKTINADCITGYCREHRRLSETRMAYNREYYQGNKADLQEYARQWRLMNPDQHRAAVRAWNAANRGARQASHARRRQRVLVEMTAQDRRESAQRRDQIREDPCFYCPDPVASDTDHFFPLAKGGTDHWWNLVRACDSCNSRKNASCGTAFLLRTGQLVPFGEIPLRPGFTAPSRETEAA